jgi:peptidyl-prolyl cis-trans isomerase D
MDKSVTREQAGGVDRRIVEAAFAAPRPGPKQTSFNQVDLGTQGYAVVAVTAVQDADVARTDAGVMERVKRQLLARRGAEYYANYRAGLRRDADIQIYPDQL